MASSRARRRDRMSILDMSIEDDSLLPGPAQDQEMRPQPEVDEVSAVVMAPLPPPARKAKKQHNLRKSLAWDKAFLTGEGVLDPDELPIPTRSSPKKLPELPTLQVKAAGHDDCSPSVDKDAIANRESLRARSFSERFADSRFKPLDLPVLHGLEEHRETCVSPVVPRCAPGKKAIESAIEKGTRLRLPSTFIAEERKNIPRPSKPPKDSNLTKRVTSVSRRVKDTLGRVLPGGRVDSTANRSTAVRASTSDVSTVTDEAESSLVMEDSDSGEPSCMRAQLHPINTSGASSSDDLRLKPTGLRMPSAKLGFFDSGRPPTQHRYATRSATRVLNGTAATAATAAAAAVQPSAKARPHGLPKGRLLDAPATERVSSAIPPAPHLRNKAVCSGGQENSKTREATMTGDENIPPPVNAASKSPLAMNAGLLNSGAVAPKEKGSSFFALAKKAVARLSSPVQDKGTGVACRSGDGGEEAAAAPAPSTANQTAEDATLVKTGPVQHSPPNKPAPEPNPWSPVRKNTAQLGPFDCTKSNAQTAWE